MTNLMFNITNHSMNLPQDIFKLTCTSLDNISYDIALAFFIINQGLRLHHRFKSIEVF